MQSEHLSLAPIKEAIIEFRFNQKIDLANIFNLEKKLPSGYSGFQSVVQQEFGFSFQDGEIQTTDAGRGVVSGYRSDNESLKTVVIFESDKFIFSKLAPYTNWNDLKSQAMNIWQIFKPSKDLGFSRIATRYVNEINLPIVDGELDFDEYLTICPKIPKGMPDILIGFLSKVAVPYYDEGITATVTLSSGNLPPHPNKLSVMLDIDIFRAGQLALSDRELWAAMDILRDVKNTAFFGSITEKTKELCR